MPWYQKYPDGYSWLKLQTQFDGFLLPPGIITFLTLIKKGEKTFICGFINRNTEVSRNTGEDGNMLDMKMHPENGLWLRCLPNQWRPLEWIYARVFTKTSWGILRRLETTNTKHASWSMLKMKPLSCTSHTFPQSIFWRTFAWVKHG